MPAGFEVTVPVPLPVRVTTRVWLRANEALTLVSLLTVSVHGPVPVQPPPLQPRNTEPAWGVAVSVTGVPWSTVVLHAPGQLMPLGFDVTVPRPLPARATVTVRRAMSNDAPTA